MSPSKIVKRVVVDRVNWVEQMLEGIESLPLQSFESFVKEKRNVWAGESCLRRALEALMDLGRHILAKGFGEGITEHEQIGLGLENRGYSVNLRLGCSENLLVTETAWSTFIRKFRMKNFIAYVPRKLAT